MQAVESFYLRWGQDGLLYTTIARYVTAIDPVTMKARKLVDTQTNLMDLGVDGSIYYTSGPTLFKLPVPLAQVSISMAKITLDQGQSEPIISSGVLETDFLPSWQGAPLPSQAATRLFCPLYMGRLKHSRRARRTFMPILL